MGYEPSRRLRTICGIEFTVPEDYARKHREAKFRLDKEGYPMRMVSPTRRCSDVAVNIEVLGRREGYVIDHKDGNRLNNSRENLRHVSQAENNQNRRPLARKQYKCITWEPETGKFRVRITAFGIKISAGRFLDEIEAVAVSNIYLAEFHRDMAVLNPTGDLKSYADKLSELKSSAEFMWRFEMHKRKFIEKKARAASDLLLT